MIAPLILAAQLGVAPPQLELLTPPQAGTTLVYQISGTLTGVPEFLLLDFTLLPIPFELPPFGALHLALTPLLQIIPGDNSHLFSIPAPPNPNLAGVVVHAQGFGFVFDGQSGNNKLTNLVSATLTAPRAAAALSGRRQLRRRDPFDLPDRGGHRQAAPERRARARPPAARPGGDRSR